MVNVRRFMLYMLACLIAAISSAARAGKHDIAPVRMPPPPRVWTIAVGINKYPNIQYASCVSDATAFSAAMQKGKTSQETVFLLDEKATREGILSAFASLAPKMKPDDVFVFYFAGRGAQEAKDSYLCPSDVNTKDLKATCISSALLQSWLSKIPARSSWIIMDTCDSGGIASAFNLSPEQNAMLFAMSGQSLCLFSVVGRAAETKAHGILTAALLSGLSERMNKLGEVTTRYMEAYVTLELANNTVHNENFSCVRRGKDFSIAYFMPDKPDALPASNLPNSPGKEPNRSKLVSSPLPDPDAVPPGKNYAILIATDHYDDKAAFRALSNPIFDAEAIGAALKSFGFILLGEPSGVLKDPKCSEVYTTLKAWQEKKYAAGDTLVIFIAGHGVMNEDIQDGQLAFKDSQADAAPGEDHMLLMGVLRKMVDRIPCKHILLICDACYSGAFNEELLKKSLPAPQRSETEPASRRKISDAEFAARKRRWTARKFLASAGLKPVSDGAPGQHSPFATKLLEVLRDYADRGELLTYSQIVDTMERRQPEPMPCDFGDNQPGAEIVLIPAEAPTH